MLKGREYGALGGQNIFQKGILKLHVDGAMVYNNIVVASTYSNGYELGAPISPNVLKMLSSGSLLEVEINIPGEETSVFKYSLMGSGKAIASAKNSCR